MPDAACQARRQLRLDPGGGLQGGDTSVCPGIETRPRCDARGTFSYTMTLYGSGGQVLDTATAAVTV